MARAAVFALFLSCMPRVGASAQPSFASEPRWTVDVESGAAFSGYNDVRIPGEGGTRLSLSEELAADPVPFMRIGLTGKIRDASIALWSEGAKAEKTNTGFVPLLNFGFLWSLSEPLRLILEADALAAPQGRAADVLAGVERDLGKRLSLRGGYRLLEGGADNDEVYTFALLHHVSIGAVIRL